MRPQPPRFAILAAVLALAPIAIQAEVARVEITSRQDVLSGKSFGSTGAYEKLKGKVYFAVDPANPHNQIIADLDKAPRNAQGKVEFSADLFILKPKDPARGNGVLFFDVVNRGNKGLLSTFDHAKGSADPTAEADFGNGLLLRDPSVDGMKTGHTDSAGFCLITSAKRNGMRLISVVMGSPSVKAREDASSALLNYGYTFYETARLKSAGELILKPRVYKSVDGFVPLVVPYNVIVTVGRGQLPTLKSTAHLFQEPLVAPLAVNQPVGELTIKDPAGDIVAHVPLAPRKAVPAGGLWTRAVDDVRLWFN